MDFNKLPMSEQKKMADLMFAQLSSKEELKDWIMLFFGLEYPYTMIDRESTSNPLDAIWQVYHAYKVNDGQVPGIIWLSARECLKTVSVAILEIILLLHFKLEIAHGAATEAQSHVCLRYIEGFLFKIECLMKIAGWENLTANKRTFEFGVPDGRRPFIKVVICTPRGMNSLHANLFVVDELDLADPAALAEGKNIVGYSRGIHGFTLFLSTRKYSHGLMAEIIDKKDEMGYDLLRWNLLDVTEKCLPDRYCPEFPKENRYVSQQLPLKQLAIEEYDLLSESEKKKFELLENVHSGCAKCLLLPICKTNLSKLPDDTTGGFYKPIKSVIQKFRENSPEIAEAQLLCWRPGSTGLVYPRFVNDPNNGNTISLSGAYETLTGEILNVQNELILLAKMRELGIEFFAGVDWGFSHDTVITVVAEIPNGEIWLMDTFASPGLEFSDVLLQAITYRDKYGPSKWFCDTAMPSHLKSFNKNGMKSPNFTKDVIGGIEAVRSKIVTSTGNRPFKILNIDNNKKMTSAILKHRFKLDGQGNPTPQPDDEPGVADACDALRYIFQNKWPVKGPQKPGVSWTETEKFNISQDPQNTNQMKNEILKRIGPGGLTISNGKKGGFHFNF
jgi:hypothetical protein